MKQLLRRVHKFNRAYIVCTTKYRLTANIFMYATLLSVYEEIHLTSEGRIFASCNSLANAEFGSAAKRLGSSYSCKAPLDKTRILYEQKTLLLHHIV
jgi:hypothetical protein